MFQSQQCSVDFLKQQFRVSSGATEHTKKCHGCFDWLHPKTLSIKNRYYDRKVRESLGIDMAVVKYGQEILLNRDNGNFVRTNAWKPLF